MVPRKTCPRNFWPDLEISETFLTGVKVLFSGDLGVLKAHYFFLVNGSQSLRFVFFFFRLVFGSQIFHCSLGTELIKLG